VASLLDHLASDKRVRPLRDLARLRIGYVSGAVPFFHLTEPERKSRRVTSAHLTKILARGTYATGARFTTQDWIRLHDHGRICWLFSPAQRQSAAVKGLLTSSAGLAAARRAKSAAREPWWRIPLPDTPDAFLVYMGNRIRMVENVAKVQAPNSLYVIDRVKDVSVDSLVVGSLTSVFQASTTINARHKGGGLVKLEPSDANRSLLPAVDVSSKDVRQLDGLVRADRWCDAILLADDIVLRRGLALSRSQISQLQDFVLTPRLHADVSNTVTELRAEISLASFETPTAVS
jgi:hypothetical protein